MDTSHEDGWILVRDVSDDPIGSDEDVWSIVVTM